MADDLDCDTDDDVIDTPPQNSGHTDCPSFPQSGCSQSEMFMNFMDYVDDPCMIMFTKGQSDRMLATINTYRSGLIDSDVICMMPHISENNSLLIYPNPSSDLFHCWYAIPQMRIIKYGLYNSVGQLVTTEEQLINQDFYINLQAFSPGVYFLKIDGIAHKLVKI